MTAPPAPDRDPAPRTSESPARRWWQRLKATAFPPGAITFHLGVWAKRRVTVADREEARRLADRHRLEDLLVVHGNALDVGGRAALVAGPSGIGKSTACRNLALRGAARTLEDGLVLVGVSGARWVVIETGTFEVLHSASFFRHLLAPWLGRSAACRAPHASGPADPEWPIGTPAHALAFRLAVLRHAGHPAGFRPRLFEIALLAVAAAADPFPSLRFRPRGSLEVIRDVAALAPASLRTTVFSTRGGAPETAERIERTVLSLE